MSILIFGKTGQVATELQNHAQVIAVGRDQANLSNPQICADVIRKYTPKAVINAAAYTAVDAAENDEAMATVINGDAPAVMAQTCAELDIPFVHISTDYVFAGTGETLWKPGDPTSPRNAYGRSKLAGENAVRQAGGRYAILRTSWVFSAHGTNFVKTMLQLSNTRDHLTIVGDQVGGPTPACAIAEACLEIAKQLSIDTQKAGTYHFSGTPDVSWCDFASEIFRQGNRKTTVSPIRTIDYPTPAMRPLNSRLNCSQTETIFSISRPDWKIKLTNIIKELDA